MLAATLLACGETEVTTPGAWPQFRGPEGNGVSADLGLPTTWAEDSDNLAWKVEIPGKGNSSAIVSHGRVFLTTATQSEGQAEKFVLALDFATGEMLWQTQVGTATTGKFHRYNTLAAQTPATDGRHIFAHFGDSLVSLDREGEILWTKVVDDQYAKYSHYGSASSPVLTEKAVIVAHDRETTDKPYAWIAAFDKKTGDELWKVEWTDGCCSYTTPLVRRRGDHEEVIFTKSGGVVSYDASTGEELWKHPVEINQPVASPVTEGDILAALSGAHNVRSGKALRMIGSGKETQIEELWQSRRAIPQTSSPVAFNGKLFTLVELGHMVCYDLQTGRMLWQRRLSAGNGYRASLVAGDGKIYAQASNGTTLVIADAPKFRQLAANSLERGGNSSPVLAEQSILIRSKTHLYKFSGEDKAPES